MHLVFSLFRRRSAALLLSLSGVLTASSLMADESTPPAEAPTLFPRKMVVEEGTGSWCGYCPRGIVAFERMRREQADRFIGIAVHRRDEMVCADYSPMSFRSYPSCHVNRRLMGVSVYYAVLRNLLADEAAPVAQRVETTVERAGEDYVLTTQTTFGYTSSAVNFRLAYVVTEDGVGPYLQRNYFSTFDEEDMERWYGAEGWVSHRFDDVARALLTPFDGAPGSVPAAVERDVPNRFSLRFRLPAAVKDPARAKVVTLLLNTETGEIANADEDALVAPTALSPLQAEGAKPAAAPAAAYDLSGRRVNASTRGVVIEGGRKRLR